MKKAIKKEFGVPMFIPDEGTGFRKAVEEKMRGANQNGKGDKPRPVEDIETYRTNWDEIFKK